MELGEPDAAADAAAATGEFLDLDCDTVIYALGTKANPIVTQSTPDWN
jgi:glutamate synthase (NADPH) small chain